MNNMGYVRVKEKKKKGRKGCGQLYRFESNKVK